ncbi:MAG: YceI family protein [Actinomycetota bacterium]|nr:YceI family protein [Actinomycetota bacterium]
MGIQEGSHKIGPDNGSLTVKTGREGAASKAGHNLTLEATSWEGTVEVGDSASVELSVDPSGIEVSSGEGGAKPLGDDEKGDIKKSMDDKVLGSDKITFQSSEADFSSGNVKGDLSIAGQSNSVEIPLDVGDDGTVKGSVTLSQDDYGIKQFKALMGALKVSDAVEVHIEAKLPTD